MANELNSAIGVTGLTDVTASVVLGSSIIASGIACSEVSGTHGLYTGNMTSAPAGSYVILFISGGQQINSGYLAWDGAREITMDALAAILETQSGTGDAAVTVIVHDASASPLANAMVTARANGVLAGTSTTDVSGHAPLHLSAGTYVISATCVGFDGAMVTITISGSTSTTIVLDRFTPQESEPGLSTGYLTCVDLNGDPLSGIVHTLRVLELPINVVGLSIDMADREVTSTTGMNNVQFSNILPGGRYSIQRGSGDPTEFEGKETDFQIPVSGALT